MVEAAGRYTHLSRTVTPEDERALLRALARGERAALGRAMDQHLGLVYSLAYGMLGNHADADDLCSEVFLRLQQSAPRISPDGSLHLWLYKTCLNCCIDELRRRARRPGPDLEGAFERLAASAPGPEELATDHDFTSRVAACLLRLPPRQRAVFTLRHFGGLTTSEIAKYLGCARGTVKSHLSRALAGLREMLPAEPEESQLGR
jgi:RNA polymerase sigma-70 factor (ECF subfamily)